MAYAPHASPLDPQVGMPYPSGLQPMVAPALATGTEGSSKVAVPSIKPLSTPAGSADARVAVADRLADKLDRRGVADEMLQAMQEQETTSMRRCPAVGVDAELRGRLLYLVHGLLHQTNAKEQCWFEVARVLDISGPWHGADPPSTEAVLTRATALCSVAEALEGTSGAWPGVRRFVPKLVASASGLSTGLGGRPIVMEEVMREQCSLLRELDAAPNVARWLSVFAARFDVATDGVFAKRLEYLEYIASQVAARLVIQAPMTAKHPPRNLAVGAFAVALVCVGVVPAGTLKPEGVNEQFWVARLASLQMPNPSACDTDQRAVPRGAVLAALELATRTEAPSIRFHALAALGGN